MTQQFETKDSARKYLNNFFIVKDSWRIKTGVYNNFKVDFVNCKLKIFLGRCGYHFKLFNKTKTYTSLFTTKFQDILDELKKINNYYTLNMNLKKIYPKKDFEDEIVYNNAIETMLGIKNENCYICGDYLSVKTPCSHYYCSKCYYETIEINDKFKCEVCSKIYVKVASRKMYETEGDIYAD